MATRKIAQKIPFKPTKKQVKFFADCFGARRFAYNSQVAVFNTYSEENKELVYPKITDLKRENEWLKTSVVPKFVADWVDDSREYRFGFDEWFDYENQPPKVYDWLNSGNQRQEELNALALVTLIVKGANAVEIEQEKLYTVEIEGVSSGKLFKNIRTNKFLFHSGKGLKGYTDRLTEKEIKEADERLWQFAGM